MGLFKISFGDYPAEYNPKVHGTYDPARYYGKPDTPFGQVKLCDLRAWIGRRRFGVRPLAGALSRAIWAWQHKYVQPKNSSYAYFFQAMTAGMILHYYMNFGKKLNHRHMKYH